MEFSAPPLPPEAQEDDDEEKAEAKEKQRAAKEAEMRERLEKFKALFVGSKEDSGEPAQEDSDTKNSGILTELFDTETVEDAEDTDEHNDIQTEIPPSQEVQDYALRQDSEPADIEGWPPTVEQDLASQEDQENEVGDEEDESASFEATEAQSAESDKADTEQEENEEDEEDENAGTAHQARTSFGRQTATSASVPISSPASPVSPNIPAPTPNASPPSSYVAAGAPPLPPTPNAPSSPNTVPPSSPNVSLDSTESTGDIYQNITNIEKRPAWGPAIITGAVVNHMAKRREGRIEGKVESQQEDLEAVAQKNLQMETEQKKQQTALQETVTHQIDQLKGRREAKVGQLEKTMTQARPEVQKPQAANNPEVITPSGKAEIMETPTVELPELKPEPRDLDSKIVLDQVEAAADHDIAVENYYELRHEAKDEPTVASGAQYGISGSISDDAIHNSGQTRQSSDINQIKQSLEQHSHHQPPAHVNSSAQMKTAAYIGVATAAAIIGGVVAIMLLF